jgi:hypothetical protein
LKVSRRHNPIWRYRHRPGSGTQHGSCLPEQAVYDLLAAEKTRSRVFAMEWVLDHYLGDFLIVPPFLLAEANQVIE